MSIFKHISKLKIHQNKSKVLSLSIKDFGIEESKPEENPEITMKMIGKEGKFLNGAITNKNGSLLF